MSSAADTADLPSSACAAVYFHQLSFGASRGSPTVARRPRRRRTRIWSDKNEFSGGDAWDLKIRRQIRKCTYFMLVISARTKARREGYFRCKNAVAFDRHAVRPR
jgi:hypothetical protein